MRGPYQIVTAFLCVVACTPLAANAGKTAADAGAAALATRVATFSIHNATVFDGVAQLSSERTELSFALEDVLKTKFSDSAVPHSHFDLNLQNRTISEILDALCSKDVTYTWTRDGLTVNVFPRSIVDDSSYLPNRQLGQSDLRGVTDTEQAVFAIVARLPPPFEQIACAQAGGDTSYAVPWDVTFRNLTIRQAFNLIARHLGSRGGWVLGGSREFRTIGFHKGTIHYNSGSERID